MTAEIICTGCKHGYAEAALFCPNCGRPKLRESTADALVGKLLGERFQVQALIGQGGSGTIYRAEHVTLRRKVAIKVLHAELSRDELAVERFRREATTVADIDNEHIVEIHDFGRTPDGRLYLAMELLEGETLDAVLEREKQLSMERAADILIQVGEALMEAHAIGYVHRDLRPRNIYLTTRRGKANFVKLLDFGLAKLVEVEKEQPDATNLGMTFGDPRYMSPEQARGDRIDRRADIYQLGCVAYEMLTGAPPFSGARVFDILTKQVTDTPTPIPTKRPGTPLWMEAAVAKMLAKDPANRFATTTRLVEALRRGLDTGEVMDDEVARRRESVPPASVSRVMQRLGLNGPPEMPAPLPAAAAAAPVVKQSSEPSVRRTGTPKVGVPVVKAPADAPGSISSDGSFHSSTAGAIEPRGAGASSSRAKSSADLSTESNVWYDDDDKAPNLGDSMYEEGPKPRRWGLIVGAIGFLAMGGLVAFAMTRGPSEKKPEAPPPPVAKQEVVAPSQIIDDAGVTANPPVASTVVSTTPTGTQVATTTKRPSNGSSGTNNSRPNPINTTPSGFSPPGTPSGFSPPGTPTNTFVPPGTTNPPTNTFVPPGSNTPPPPTNTPKDPGVSGDGPLDPYGTGGEAPPSPSNPPTSEPNAGDQKADFYANLGTQQLNAGDTGNAAANFQKALAIDARNANAITGMGDIALRQGLFADAIAHLKKASQLTRSARVFTLLGEAYLNSGNSAQAATAFKKALQIDPDNSRARDGYNEATNRGGAPTE
ncbi:MAG TPA: protein kinase [Kofleriaceae bacterium]